MSFKLIFIVAATALLTIILMNNTDEMDFWLFGPTRINKLAVMGGVFLTGCIVGYLARGRKQAYIGETEDPTAPRTGLSEEDREYIS